MRTPLRNIRLDDERWEAFRNLLGMEWLRKEIDKAVAKEARKQTTKEKDQ